MMLSGTAMGVLLGCMLGVGNAIVLWRLSRRHPWLQAVALVDLIVMPLIGWAIGAFLLEGMI